MAFGPGWLALGPSWPALMPGGLSLRDGQMDGQTENLPKLHEYFALYCIVTEAAFLDNFASLLYLATD